MLYIGNFSYTDLTEDADNYCLMPAVVDAPDTETALQRFADLLRKLHESPLLAGAQDVYLDSLVEVGDTPEEPLLVQWQKIVAGEDGLYSVLNALPGNEDYAEAYSWAEPDDDYDDEADDDAEEDLQDLFEGEETDPQELADSLTEALTVLLTGDGLEALGDEDFGPAEEAFLSFDD